MFSTDRFYSSRLKCCAFPGGGICKVSNSPHMSLNLTIDSFMNG